MAFKFIRIVVAGFIIHFGTAVAQDHDDCFNYNCKYSNGKKRIEIYNECGITDSKTLNPKRLKCVAKASEILNEDETIKKEKLRVIIKNCAYPEYTDKIIKILEGISSQSEKDVGEILKSPVEALSQTGEDVGKILKSPVEALSQTGEDVGEILKSPVEALSQTGENIYLSYIIAIPKICPKDQIFGNP